MVLLQTQDINNKTKLKYTNQVTEIEKINIDHEQTCPAAFLANGTSSKQLYSLRTFPQKEQHLI